MIRQRVCFHVRIFLGERQNLLINQVLDLIFEGPIVIRRMSYIPDMEGARGIMILVRMKGRRGCRDFFRYDGPYVNQIWHKFIVWHQNFINLRVITKVVPVILALALAPFVTVVPLILIFLSR